MTRRQPYARNENLGNPTKGRSVLIVKIMFRSDDADPLTSALPLFPFPNWTLNLIVHINVNEVATHPAFQADEEFPCHQKPMAP